MTAIDVRRGQTVIVSGQGGGMQGEPGPGVPSGGSNGDVVVKDGPAPYAYRTVSKTVVDARDHGVVGGGVDTTTALQAALAYAETLLQHDGAFAPDREPRVVVPPGDYYSVSGITIPQGVVLDMQGGELRALAGTTTLVTAAGDRSGICNAFLQDLTLSANTTAVRLLGFQSQVRNVVFNKFGGPAIRVEKNAARIHDVWAQNCLGSADTLSAPTGVLHVDTAGNDISVTGLCEVSASRLTMSASGFAYGVVAKGKLGNYHGVIAEISDHGWYITELGNKFTACRGELNMGHGFVFDGGSGPVVGCYAWNNGRSATNTFDGFNVAGTSPRYEFMVCEAVITAGNTHRYGFSDAGTSSTSTAMGCNSTGHGTAALSGMRATMWGTNTPEGAVAAPVGSLFLRTNGGAGTTLYIKESGTGNTGWLAPQSANADLTDLIARWVPANAAGAARLEFAEDTDNGANVIMLIAPAAIASDQFVVLPAPSATDTIVARTTTDTLTNKTLTDPKITKAINAQTGTTYTAVLADASKLVTCTNAAAITFTVPPNSSVAFPVGTEIQVAQLGAGQVTLTQGAGVTITGTPGLKTRAQNSRVTLVKLATDTWLASDDLAA